MQLQQLVSRPDIQSTVRQFAPQYSNTLDLAQSLIRVVLDVSRMGKELCDVALIGADIIHGSPLAVGSTKPLISASYVLDIEGSLIHPPYYTSHTPFQLRPISIKELPTASTNRKRL